jgi:c-di-GMP-binding flagellar brake protein YcgR
MTGSGLMMRRSERHDIALPAKVRVSPEHGEAVVYAKGVADERGWLPVELVDFSTGGFGFASGYFFPRGVKLEIRVESPVQGDDRELLSCQIRIMRVQMTDRRPAYLCGASFADANEEVREQAEALLAELNGGDFAGGAEC